MDRKYLHFPFDITATLFTLLGTRLISIPVETAIMYSHVVLFVLFFLICGPYVNKP